MTEPNNNIKLSQYERLRKTAVLHAGMETEKLMKDLSELNTEVYPQLKYFYERIKSLHDKNNQDLASAHVIAMMCNYVPEELIIALGAFPLRICSGFNAMDNAGSSFLPAKACPLVKAVAGSIHLEYFPFGANPKLIINPTSCDQKKKIAEITESQNILYYTLDVPSVKDQERARQYWIKSVNELVKVLEKTTGKNLTRKNLKKAILSVAAAQKEFRRLDSIRKRGPVIYGTDVILISNVYFFDDIEKWSGAISALNDELEMKLQRDEHIGMRNSPRLLITGSPSIAPNLKLPLLVESLGGLIVADDFCSSNRLLYDTVAVDEWFLYDMIPALADRYLKPSTCPNLTPNDDRQRKLINLIKENRIQGVIYQTFPGCHLFEMETARTLRTLEKEDVPVLTIESDYSPDDKGQLSTRIEAFLESLK